MPALNLGYLLRAANTGLASARQGTREREELERQREIEDSSRMFNEWAKRNQMEFQNRQLNEQSRLRDATIEGTNTYRQGQLEAKARDDETRRLVAEALEAGKNRRFEGAGGSTVQDAGGQFQVLPKNTIGPTGVRAPLPESRDGIQGAGQPRVERPPTDSESKDYLYWGYVKNGNASMDQVKDRVDPKKVTAYLTSRFFKPALSAAEQQFINGAKVFAAGVLRKETGAAIANDELMDVIQRYIDMGLDAPEVRAIKQANRAQMEQTFEKMSRRAREYYDRPPQGRRPLNEIIPPE